MNKNKDQTNSTAERLQLHVQNSWYAQKLSLQQKEHIPSPIQ